MSAQATVRTGAGPATLHSKAATCKFVSHSALWCTPARRYERGHIGGWGGFLRPETGNVCLNRGQKRCRRMPCAPPRVNWCVRVCECVCADDATHPNEHVWVTADDVLNDPPDVRTHGGKEDGRGPAVHKGGGDRNTVTAHASGRETGGGAHFVSNGSFTACIAVYASYSALGLHTFT